MPVSRQPLPTCVALEARGRRLDFSGGTQVIGILNVTPDSFFDGGLFGTEEAALAQALLMQQEGAAVIDVGGQSTRPGFVEISAEEEVRRVLPVVRALSARGIVVSVDTYKPDVAKAALAGGAAILNDIHGLQKNPELATLAASHGAAVIAMHHEEGFESQTGDVIDALRRYFEKTLSIAAAAGIPKAQVVLDPGVGFHKTPAQNVEVMARLGELHDFGCPLLLAASRKSVFGHVLGLPKEERLEATLATTVAAALDGVQWVRVHDVKANVRAARMGSALRAAKGNLS